MLKKLYTKFGEAGFLFASTVLVNLGNYAINLLLGRFLGPQDFAEANILATLVLVLSFTALGFQLTTAKFIAEFKAKEEDFKIATFLLWIRKKSLAFSFILLATLLICIHFINGYLNMQRSIPVLILFLGIPLYIHMSVSRGFFQGMSKFKDLAFTYLAEMLGRLIFTIVLIYLVFKFDLPWASEAVALGFLASFIFSFFIGRKAKVQNTASKSQDFLKPVFQFFMIIGLYELSQIMINNSDVVIVKHFFENYEAGLYASLALIGRVVFFATWTIVTLLFPKVIEKEKKGERHIHLFWISLSVVGFIGSGIVLSCFLMDEFIVNILFGSSYLSIAPLLWKYAVATTLFSCANVFVYYHMSLNNYIPVFISLAAGSLQIIGLYIFHQNILEVINVQIIVMSLLILALIPYHMITSYRSLHHNKPIKKALKLEEYA